MMLLDALEGCAKNYKHRFFLSTLLLDAEETEKQEEKKAKKSNTHFWGGPWKRAGSSSTIIYPKIGFFQNPQNPYSYSVSRKMGGNHFFKKAMLQGGQT